MRTGTATTPLPIGEAAKGGGTGTVTGATATAPITVELSGSTLEIAIDLSAAFDVVGDQLALADAGVALTKLATQANGTILANVAGSTASPTAVLFADIVRRMTFSPMFTDCILPGSVWDRYAMPGQNTINTRASVAIASANVLYAVPLTVTSPVTVDRLGVRLVTQNGSGKNMRVGIWQQTSASDHYPSALVVDSGNIPCSSDNSTTGFKAITVSAVLEPGVLYWIGVVSDATPTIQGSGLAQSLPWLGADNSGTLTQGCISVSFTFGALGTFPGSAAPSQMGSGGGPILYYRANRT